MRLKKNANNFNLNKNFIKKNNNKVIHKKIDKKGHKVNKLSLLKVNEAALYKLRNKKVIEKKNYVKRMKRSKKSLNNPELELNSNETVNEILDKSNNKFDKVINKSNNELSISNSKNNTIDRNSTNIIIPNCNLDSSITFTRTFVDAESKLKVLDLYYKLDSYDEASKLTGIHSQTIRYWRKTEQSIREKVRNRESFEKSSPELDLKSMISEAKEALKRSLSNKTTSFKSITRKSRLKSPNKLKTHVFITNDSTGKEVENMNVSDNEQSIKPRKSRLKKTDLLELSNGLNNNNSPRKSMKKGFTKEKRYSQQSHSSSLPDIDSVQLEGKNSLNKDPKVREIRKSTGTLKNHNSRKLSNKNPATAAHDKPINKNSKTQSNSDPKIVKFVPNLDTVENVVEEINKLSNVFESKDCLESLDSHFMNLQSHQKLVFHDSLLPSKNKLQDETFKHIMIDFFQGEYKLLMEINHQYQQLKQKKSKNFKKNVENLKRYFTGSMHRLLVLKQQLVC